MLLSIAALPSLPDLSPVPAPDAGTGFAPLIDALLAPADAAAGGTAVPGGGTALPATPCNTAPADSPGRPASPTVEPFPIEDRQTEIARHPGLEPGSRFLVTHQGSAQGPGDEEDGSDRAPTESDPVAATPLPAPPPIIIDAASLPAPATPTAQPRVPASPPPIPVMSAPVASATVTSPVATAMTGEPCRAPVSLQDSAAIASARPAESETPAGRRPKALTAPVRPRESNAALPPPGPSITADAATRPVAVPAPASADPGSRPVGERPAPARPAATVQLLPFPPARPAAARPELAVAPTPAVAPPPSPAPPIAPAPILPALQAFGVAMRQALRDERRPVRDEAQPVAATPLAAPAPALPEFATPTPLDTRDARWPHAMAARIEQLRDQADAADTRIRLVPDALGTIDVRLQREGDAVHVHFAAREADTRALLADAQPRLAEAAEARGLKLGRTEVTTGDPSTEGRQPHARPHDRPAPSHPAPSRPAPARATPVHGIADDIRIA